MPVNLLDWPSNQFGRQFSDYSPYTYLKPNSHLLSSADVGRAAEVPVLQLGDGSSRVASQGVANHCKPQKTHAVRMLCDIQKI